MYLEKVYDNSGSIQTAKCSRFEGELNDNVPRPQDYGLTSRPGSGCTGLAVSIGALRVGLTIVKLDDVANRPTLPSEWDVALWRRGGSSMKLLANGEIVIEAASGGKVTVNADSVELGGTGELKKLLTEAAGEVFNDHAHEYVSPGGPLATTKPITTAPLVPLPASTIGAGMSMGESHQTSITKGK